MRAKNEDIVDVTYAYIKYIKWKAIMSGIWTHDEVIKCPTTYPTSSHACLK